VSSGAVRSKDARSALLIGYGVIAFVVLIAILAVVTFVAIH